MAHNQIDFTIAPLILGPHIETSSRPSAPRHPLDESGVREGDPRSTFLSNNISYLLCAPSGIGGFLLSTEEADETRVFMTLVEEVGRNEMEGGYIGGGATRRIESEGTDWAEEDADDAAKGRAGKFGFRAGRGGGVDFAGERGALFAPTTAKAGRVALLSRSRGFLRGMYGKEYSGIGWGIMGVLALLLKAAIVSATDGVDVLPAGSPASPSEDKETDCKDEVDSA